MLIWGGVGWEGLGSDLVGKHRKQGSSKYLEISHRSKLDHENALKTCFCAFVILKPGAIWEGVGWEGLGSDLVGKA